MRNNHTVKDRCSLCWKMIVHFTHNLAYFSPCSQSHTNSLHESFYLHYKIPKEYERVTGHRKIKMIAKRAWVLVYTISTSVLNRDSGEGRSLFILFIYSFIYSYLNTIPCQLFNKLTNKKITKAALPRGRVCVALPQELL